VSKTYEQGLIDMSKAYGRACGSCDSCEQCNVGIVKGEGISCPEFAQKFPKKFVSLILDQTSDGISYYQEYLIRFPRVELSVDELVSLGMCRKAIFDGNAECNRPSSDCKGCWLEKYTEEE